MGNEMNEKMENVKIEELKDRIYRAVRRLSKYIGGDIYRSSFVEVVAAIHCDEWSEFAEKYLYDKGIDLYVDKSEYIDPELNETYLWNIVVAENEEQVLKALRRYARALEKEYKHAKERVHRSLYADITRNFQRQYAAEFNEKRFCVFVYNDNGRLSAIIVCRSMSRAKTIAREYSMNTTIHTAKNSKCLLKRVHKIAVKEWEELAKEEKVGLYLEKEFYSADDVETKEGYVDIYKILNMIRR